jgi:hypothetical protein
MDHSTSNNNFSPLNSPPYVPANNQVAAEKWSIATYLRVKPFEGEAPEQIIYDIQGGFDVYFYLLK